MTSQSRGWLLASVAAVVLLGLFVSQIDQNKLYQRLQTDLAEIGLTLEADNISISMMYLGSIQLNGVHVQTGAFNLDAERLFIDLNLAALFTGSAIPRALFLQRANINVLKNEESAWLDLIGSNAFKLNRIDMSQSAIHFKEQSLTLSQVNLDIRDIGKNKNPRLELRAHIGEGRLDAHGYLRLKRGEITQGFGRLKIYDVPLSSIEHQTTLDTLNGSITTHLNPDNTWQSFGHLSLQTEKQNKLELRGKLTGNHNQLFNIEDMILNIKQAGAVQVSGYCSEKDDCNIQFKSGSLDLTPIIALTGNNAEVSRPLQSLNIETTWQNNTLTSSGQVSWDNLEFILPASTQEEQDAFNLISGTFVFDNLKRNDSGDWSVPKVKLLTGENKHIAVTISDASYQQDQWNIPVQLYDTELWLPIAKAVFMLQAKKAPLKGSGTMRGYANIKLIDQSTSIVDLNIDAKDAQVQWGEYFKPPNIDTNFKGDITINNFSTESANLLVQAEDAYASVSYQDSDLNFKQVSIDFDLLKDLGFKFGEPLQDYHGYVMGNVLFHQLEADPQIADIEVIDFGKFEHSFSGAIKKERQIWKTKNLLWTYQNNKAYISTNRWGIVQMDAETLDSEGLRYFLSMPIQSTGSIKTNILSLPIGNFSNVSSTFKKDNQHIVLKHFKSMFYDGTMRSKKIDLSLQDSHLNLSGAVQMGGIRIVQWSWLQEQFQANLKGSLYATLNLNGNFNEEAQLTSWKGDGDIMVYNAKWLFENNPVYTDKLSLSMRKRELLSASFEIQDSTDYGHGKIRLDENLHSSGFFERQNQSYSIKGQWPDLDLSINPTNQTIKDSITQ